MSIDQLLEANKPSRNFGGLEIRFEDLVLNQSTRKVVRGRKRIVTSFVAAAALVASFSLFNVVSGGKSEVSNWQPFALQPANAADQPRYFNFASSKILVTKNQWLSVTSQLVDIHGVALRPAETTFEALDGRLIYSGDNSGNPFAHTPPPKALVGETYFGAPWIATLPEPSNRLEDSVTNLYEELIRQARQSRLVKANANLDVWLLEAIDQLVESDVAAPAQRLAAISLWNRLVSDRAQSEPWVALDANGKTWQRTIAGEGWLTSVVNVDCPGEILRVSFTPNSLPSLDSVQELLEVKGWQIVDRPASRVGADTVPTLPSLDLVVRSASESVRIAQA